MIRSGFTAELHCDHGQVGVANTPFAAHPISSAGQDGWLCTRGARDPDKGFLPVTFHFDYLEDVGDRIHYCISCVDGWAYRGARLEQSADGWLGLYGTFVVGRLVDSLNPAALIEKLRASNYWKIETLQAWNGDLQSAEEVSFYLRDAQGHRVAHAQSVYSGAYLNAGAKDGEILTFQLRNIQLG